MSGRWIGSSPALVRSSSGRPSPLSLRAACDRSINIWIINGNVVFCAAFSVDGVGAIVIVVRQTVSAEKSDGTFTSSLVRRHAGVSHFCTSCWLQNLSIVGCGSRAAAHQTGRRGPRADSGGQGRPRFRPRHATRRGGPGSRRTHTTKIWHARRAGAGRKPTALCSREQCGSSAGCARSCRNPLTKRGSDARRPA